MIKLILIQILINLLYKLQIKLKNIKKSNNSHLNINPSILFKNIESADLDLYLNKIIEKEINQIKVDKDQEKKKRSINKRNKRKIRKIKNKNIDLVLILLNNPPDQSISKNIKVNIKVIKNIKLKNNIPNCNNLNVFQFNKELFYKVK